MPFEVVSFFLVAFGGDNDFWNRCICKSIEIYCKLNYYHHYYHHHHHYHHHHYTIIMTIIMYMWMSFFQIFLLKFHLNTRTEKESQKKTHARYKVIDPSWSSFVNVLCHEFPSCMLLPNGDQLCLGSFPF